MKKLPRPPKSSYPSKVWNSRPPPRFYAASRDGDKVSVEVEGVKNGKKETLEADVLLVAIGRRPYVQNLNLEKLGLDVDKRGRVVIDKEFNTKYPHIKAIGDVTFGPMLAHKAEEEGVADRWNVKDWSWSR